MERNRDWLEHSHLVLRAIEQHEEAIEATKQTISSLSSNQVEYRTKVDQLIKMQEEASRKIEKLIEVVTVSNGKPSLVSRIETLEAKDRALEKGKDQSFDLRKWAWGLAITAAISLLALANSYLSRSSNQSNSPSPIQISKDK